MDSRLIANQNVTSECLPERCQALAIVSWFHGIEGSTLPLYGLQSIRTPLQISDLIDIPEESGKMGSLRAYIPSFKYLCIDAKHYNEGILEEKQSLVSSLFLLEKNWEEGVESRTKQSAEYIAKHLKKEENKEATHDLIEYIVPIPKPRTEEPGARRVWMQDAATQE